MGAVVPVESYSTDNVIYTYKDFTRYLHGKVQGISRSGVGGNHHNGISENAINNVVIIAINMMINSALMWSDDSEKSLWNMAITHDVHLQNHTTHISRGMSPEEVCTRYKSSNSDLQNAHQ